MKTIKILLFIIFLLTIGSVYASRPVFDTVSIEGQTFAGADFSIIYKIHGNYNIVKVALYERNTSLYRLNYKTYNDLVVEDSFTLNYNLLGVHHLILVAYDLKGSRKLYLLDVNISAPDYKYYCDSDGDTYVSLQVSGECFYVGCVPSDCVLTQGNDCNDSNSNVNPDASEICNGVDDNCDGSIDEDGNALCDDGLYCNGFETCNGASGCSAGSPVDCSANNIASVSTCDYDPDGNPWTFDYFSGFVSTCNEETDSCTTSTLSLSHTCNLSCGAECEADSDCVFDCSSSSGCYDGKYRTYSSSVQTSCLSDCSCEAVNCSSEYTLTGTDNDDDGWDVECGDSDDNDSSVYPGAPELCDGKDNDLDDEIDEENASDCVVYYYDFDGDYYGVSLDKKCLCSASGYYRASNSGDCNDSNSNVNPGASEDCNTEFDDNCNGITNEENAANCLNFYLDFDDDGYGGSGFKCYCSANGDYKVSLSGDCDDNNSLINPGASDINNNIDDNCNGQIDENNHPPSLIHSFSNIIFDQYSNYTINLSYYFNDLDNDSLSYTYYVNDSNINVSIDGNLALFSSSVYGKYLVSFNASDPWNLSSAGYSVEGNNFNVTVNRVNLGTPNITAVWLNVSTIYTNTKFQFYYNYTDEDNDSITNVSYVLSVNDNNVSSGYGNILDNTSFWSKNDVLKLYVKIYDGMNWSSYYLTENFTVADDLPKINITFFGNNLTLFNRSSGDSSIFYCNFTIYPDADGEPYSVAAYFYVGDSEVDSQTGAMNVYTAGNYSFSYNYSEYFYRVYDCNLSGNVNSTFCEELRKGRILIPANLSCVAEAAPTNTFANRSVYIDGDKPEIEKIIVMRYEWDTHSYDISDDTINSFLEFNSSDDDLVVNRTVKFVDYVGAYISFCIEADDKDVVYRKPDPDPIYDDYYINISYNSSFDEKTYEGYNNRKNAFDDPYIENACYHSINFRNDLDNISNSSKWVKLPDTPGNYTFYVTVNDTAGKTDTVKIIVDVRPYVTKKPKLDCENVSVTDGWENVALFMCTCTNNFEGSYLQYANRTETLASFSGSGYYLPFYNISLSLVNITDYNGTVLNDDSPFSLVNSGSTYQWFPLWNNTNKTYWFNVTCRNEIGEVSKLVKVNVSEGQYNVNFTYLFRDPGNWSGLAERNDSNDPLNMTFEYRNDDNTTNMSLVKDYIGSDDLSLYLGPTKLEVGNDRITVNESDLPYHTSYYTYNYYDFCNHSSEQYKAYNRSFHKFMSYSESLQKQLFISYLNCSDEGPCTGNESCFSYLMRNYMFSCDEYNENSTGKKGYVMEFDYVVTKLK